MSGVHVKVYGTHGSIVEVKGISSLSLHLCPLGSSAFYTGFLNICRCGPTSIRQPGPMFIRRLKLIFSLVAYSSSC